MTQKRLFANDDDHDHIEVSGQLHTPAALPLRRDTQAAIRQEGWLGSMKNLPGIETQLLGRPACSLSTSQNELALFPMLTAITNILFRQSEFDSRQRLGYLSSLK
jgi:hypothetical protein